MFFKISTSGVLTLYSAGMAVSTGSVRHARRWSLGFVSCLLIFPRVEMGVGVGVLFVLFSPEVVTGRCAGFVAASVQELPSSYTAGDSCSFPTVAVVTSAYLFGFCLFVCLLACETPPRAQVVGLL